MRKEIYNKLRDAVIDPTNGWTSQDKNTLLIDQNTTTDMLRMWILRDIEGKTELLIKDNLPDIWNCVVLCILVLQIKVKVIVFNPKNVNVIKDTLGGYVTDILYPINVDGIVPDGVTIVEPPSNGVNIESKDIIIPPSVRLIREGSIYKNNNILFTVENPQELISKKLKNIQDYDVWDLPQDLQEAIIEQLPIKERIRARVLNKEAAKGRVGPVQDIKDYITLNCGGEKEVAQPYATILDTEPTEYLFKNNISPDELFLCALNRWALTSLIAEPGTIELYVATDIVGGKWWNEIVEMVKKMNVGIILQFNEGILFNEAQEAINQIGEYCIDIHYTLLPDIDGTVYIPNGVTVVNSSDIKPDIPITVTRINFPDSVTRIEIISENFDFKTITLPKNLVYIQSDAFSNSGLTNITIPDSVEYIGSYAFSGNKITKVNLPKSLKILDTHAFEQDTPENDIPLDELVIPPGVGEIFESTFVSYNIKNLVVYQGVLKMIENNNISADTTITILPKS
jgi:hypothetical protein